MPTAREILLEAAHAAVVARPWSEVRMVDDSAQAGVSRQTLYNEFGSKEGLGTALLRRRVDVLLDGAALAVAGQARAGAGPGECCVTAAGHLLRTARADPLVRAALTGCWGAAMTFPAAALPCRPDELIAELRDRVLARMPPRIPAQDRSAAPSAPSAPAPGPARACEAALRLALSFVVAPPPAEQAALTLIEQVVAEVPG
jgi:AcrR family transcriptional regulator